MTPPPESLRAILQSGIQAPSAENKHYLRFELEADRVGLVSTDTPSWTALPHRRVLALVSYGAVVENMALRAATLGHAQAAHWFPDPARTDLVAELRWSAAEPASDPLAAALEHRHTNRRFYGRKRVEVNALQRLSAAAEAIPGAQLLWLADRPRALALQAMRIAETERFRREALHEELFSAVRFEAGWHRTTEEGLPPGALEVEPPMRAAFAALRRWPLMRQLGRFGGHHALGIRAAYLPCALAPQLGLVLCDGDNDRLAAAGAGRALERTWLAATAEGLAFQPMAAAIALAHQRAGSGWVAEPAQREILRRLEQLTGGRAGSAYMFFRIGHAAAPSVTTGRPALEQFLAPSTLPETALSI
jgi:hypothetical protein